MGQARINRKISEKEGKRLMSLGWNKFENVTDEAIVKYKAMHGDNTKCPDWIFKNNMFIVQIYLVNGAWGLMRKAMIRRNDAKPVHDWSVLQRVKNEIFGEEATALEVYPKQRNLVDVAISIGFG